MLDEAWGVSPSVSLRPESFGALAYHFGTRRLVFLKSKSLVSTVESLALAPDVRSALGYAGVPEDRWPGYLAALAQLADADIIRRRVPPESR